MPVIYQSERCPGSGLLLPPDAASRYVCAHCLRELKLGRHANGQRRVADHKPTKPRKHEKTKVLPKPGTSRQVKRAPTLYQCYACLGHRYIVLPVERGQIPLPTPCERCNATGEVTVQSRVESLFDHHIPQETH